MSERITVRTPQGEARGCRDASTLVFRGIPYAVADRFSPPRPAGGWNGVRDAVASGPAAPQPDRPVARFTHGAMPQTDEHGCLTVDVCTPGLDGARPVMVWIHGGGFTIGSPGARLYYAARLAAAVDAVVVSVGYRLGSLGWLSHPDLACAPGAPAGNWGLLDQIESLRWVQRNITAFGGDPGRVTVAGQSAGALTALGLLAAPAAAGLFAGVIAQSPPLADAAAPAAAARRWAEALSAEIAGGSGFDPAALRSAPVAEILAAHEALLQRPEFRATRGATPAIEPATLPRSIAEHPGLSAEVPVLVGFTAQEGTFFFASPWRPAPAPERIPQIVSHLVDGHDPAEVLDEYARRAARRGETAMSPQALLVDIATDAMFVRPVTDWARARAATGTHSAGGVYLYRLDHPGAGPVLRATHTAEVPLLFGTWDDDDAGERLGGQAGGADAVSAAMTDAWRGFLHRADPGWEPAGEGAGMDPFVFGADRRAEEATAAS